MAKARAAIQEELYQCMFARMQRPVLLCHFNGVTLTCLNISGEGLVDDMPAVLASSGGFPTLAVVLHLHSKVADCPLPSLEIEKDKEKENLYFGTVAVCGYPPTRADYGMAYRNGVRFIIEMTQNGESSCHRISQVFKPWERGELIERDNKAGDKILKAQWVGTKRVTVVDMDDLIGHPWFDKFLTPPKPRKMNLPGLYQEDLTEELQTKFGSLSAKGKWLPHRARRHTPTWWILVALYTSFAWSSQFPAYRSWAYLNLRKGKKLSKKEAENDSSMAAEFGEFLDGLNVSGLLLDPQLKPVAWSFNSNRVNKSLHAETALCLAWIKGHPEEREFLNYTFLSPWRSCCMCASWIADVYKDSETIWFIDDPGLPKRHLDHGSNGAKEIFLPRFLERAVRVNKEFGTILKACPWFQVMGKATHWDYNKEYLTYLDSMREVDETSKEGKKEGPLTGPVDLFGSQKYFKYLEAAWDSTRSLPTSVMNLLERKGELQAYVNNIWALRRCVMHFDQIT